MESGARDEVVAYWASTVIMVVATLATMVSRFLGLDPFTWIFDALIVYVPTAALLGVALLIRTKFWIKLVGETIADEPKAERTAT